MRVVLVCGTTATAGIEGISAAGAAPDLLAHTPSADAELVAYGRPIQPPLGESHPTPVSPTGCPTPALVTRAVREVCGFDLTVLDAGLGAPSGAPTVDLGALPGTDIREPVAVRDATALFERARAFGRTVSGPLLVGESIPGGTTTALGVLTALGHDVVVSSSFPENPLDLKRRVVETGLAASDLQPGDAVDDPLRAVETMGDPVLAAVAGLVTGALERGTDVTLAGGTQLLAATAVVRALDVETAGESLSLATTSFVADTTPGFADAAERLALDLTVTDPGFTDDHVAMARYLAGEAKEGVAMGGALALAADPSIPAGRIGPDDGSLPTVREQYTGLYDELFGES